MKLEFGNVSISNAKIPKSDFDRREICAAKKSSGNDENVTKKLETFPENVPLKNLEGSFLKVSIYNAKNAEIYIAGDYSSV